MEASPLIQQTRPDVLKPKVVNLYESLFQVGAHQMHSTVDGVLIGRIQNDYFEPTEGFWRELFLLKPDAGSLRDIVGHLSADNLLHLHEVSRDPCRTGRATS